MPIKLIICYAREDEPLLNKLKSHLSPLQRQGLIEMWHDRDISAGTEWEQEISKHLNEADIILLLISPDFMDSDYCYGIEMQRAIQRHERGDARVIPVILRPVYWQLEPLSKLQALPTDAKPISDWISLDRAFYTVVQGIRKIVVAASTPPSEPPPVKPRDKGTRPVSAKVIPPIKPKEFTLLGTLTDHSDAVTAVAITPDGHRLVSGSVDNTIKLWDLHTGALLGTLTETNPFVQEATGVWSLVISPDGRTLVSGGLMSIAIRNLQTGELLNTLIDSGPFKALAISSDNTTLVSTGREKIIKVWNLHTGELLNTLTEHYDEVKALAISPDGRILVSGDDDNTINVWNLPKGKLLNTLEGLSHTFAGSSNKVTSLAISPDGQTLVSGGTNFTISIWNLRSGKLIRTLTRHAYPVTSLAISPDGHTFVSGGSGNTISLWNLHTGELLNTLSNPDPLREHSDSIWGRKDRQGLIWSLAISPDGKFLVSGSFDNTIQVWGINQTFGDKD